MTKKKNESEGHPLGPTTVEKWFKCPVLADLGTRWQPKANNWAPNMLIGKMVAAGLAIYHTAPSAKATERELSRLISEESVSLAVSEKYTSEGLVKLAHKGIKLGADIGIPFGGKVLACEENIGGARPDIVWRDSGGLRFADWKVSVSLDAQWVSQRLGQYDASWQLMDYAWRIREAYGEIPVTGAINLLVLSPRAKAYPYEIEISDERIDFWLKDAQEVWGHMAKQKAGTEARWHNWGSCTTNPYTKDKRCEFFDLCHVLHGDESKAASLYDRRARRGD